MSSKITIFCFILAYTGKVEEDDDVKVWDDNWDDDNIEDDFSLQLKSGLTH